MTLPQTALGRFRLVSALEGISYALLVFVAMPLKYGLELPQMVRVLGMTHGLLFICFVLTLSMVTLSRKWPVTRALVFFAASLVPLGAIWIERTCAAMTGD